MRFLLEDESAGTVVPKAEILCLDNCESQRIPSEGSESRNNHRYCKIWQLGGYNPTHGQNLVKNCRGIIVCQPPHRSETNAIAERRVRRVKCLLLQSSLDNGWWDDSMERYCYLRNVQDLLSERKTRHERPFGIGFDGSAMDATEIHARRLNAQEVLMNNEK